jgi:CBS domain-containing protein
MTPLDRLVVVGPDEGALDAVRTLGAAGHGQLPVVSGSTLLGLLHERDIARWLELESRRVAPARPRHA